MDAERAETYLRTLAEAKLRQARRSPSGPGGGVPAGLERAADALTQVGAISAHTAEAIVAEFRQALGVRSEPRRASLRSRLRGPLAVPVAMFPGLQRAGSPAGRRAQATAGVPPFRVTPVGRAISFGDDDRDGLYLAALIVTPDSFSLTSGSWTRDPGGDRDPMRLHRLTVSDDKGTAYHVSYNGAGTPELPGGQFELHPVPPPDIRWLDVTPGPGRPATRIDLTTPPAPAQMTTERASGTPAGLLLDRVASRLLAYWEPDRKIADSQVTGLGETLAALNAAGCLRAEDPMPGYLAALCERLGVTGHGIAATPRPDLPETWASVLAHHLRGHQGEGEGDGPRAASAAFAAALPELDGVRYAVAGLHTGYGQTWLHALAQGPAARPVPWQFPSSWWLRDDAGQWHVAVVAVKGEVYWQMYVVPPVASAATAALELMIDSQTARVRARLPLTWWTAS